jgi:enoyl-CoA hydratase/carnithine racemase
VSGMTDEVVRFRVDDDVLHVELARPPANALGLPILDGLDAALDAGDAAGATLMLVTSALPGFFAAGADIKLMAGIDRAGFEAYGDRLRATTGRIAAPGRISVAAVEGVALGGGLELALACTLRVAGADARFGLPEVLLGLIPGAGGTQRLPRVVGRGRALDIMLTARQVPADEAHAIGLVDRLVAAGSAAEEGERLIGELRRGSALARAAVVRAVDAAFDRDLADGIAFERDEVGDAFEADGTEGLQAFLEKRAPRFGGAA